MARGAPPPRSGALRWSSARRPIPPSRSPRPRMMRASIAQTLQAAGFDVTGARDLEETALRKRLPRLSWTRPTRPGRTSSSSSICRATACSSKARITSAGRREDLTRDADIPLRALRDLRLSEAARRFGGQTRAIVALDAARANPFHLTGKPLAGGLALYEPGGRDAARLQRRAGHDRPGGDR